MQLKSKTSGQSDVLKALKDAGEISDAPTPKPSAGAPAASSAATAQKKERFLFFYSPSHCLKA